MYVIKYRIGNVLDIFFFTVHLLNHALDMYRNIQEYEILPAKAYDIIKNMNFLNKTDQVKSLHALQKLIHSKIQTLD